MGMYRLVVEAVGGHGCQREVKDGGVVPDCGQPTCPDCQAKRFVKQLRETGSDVRSATLTHWPGERGAVVDDLVTNVRKGSFQGV